MPEPRQEAAVVAVGGKVYVISGQGTDPRPDTLVQVYDVATDRWSRAAPAPLALHHANAVAVNGWIYVIGGFESSFAEREAVDSVWAYDPGRDSWETRAPMPAPRGAMAAAAIGPRIYVAGGERRRPAGSTPPTEPLDDVAVYDTLTDRWETLPRLRWRRDHLAMGAIGDRLYAVGGRDRPIYEMPFTEEYDPGRGTWVERAPMPTGRSGHSGAVLDGRLFTFGGEGNPNSPLGIFDEVEAYDPVTDTWARLSPMPTPRHAMGTAVVGSRIYVPGGSTRQGSAVTALLDALAPQ